MTRSVESLLFKTRAVLCITLVAITPLTIIGCGAAPTASMPMSNTSELAQKLAGTPFAGAKSIDIDSGNQSFRISSDDPSSWMTGTYASTGSGPAYVSSLTLVSAGQVATFNFNASKEITSIVTSRGTWERSGDTSDRTTVADASTSQSEVDKYMAANTQLLAQAKQADELTAQQGQTGAQPDQSGKVGGQSLAEIAWILGGIVFVGALAFATIIFVIEVVVIVNQLF